MALPKLSHPVFELTVPSIGKDVKFRSFLVKEEKILLTAQASNDPKEIIFAIKQVINNCAQEELDVDALATFDLEYLFVKLRAKSVNNIVEIKYRDPLDDELYDIEIDLDKVEMKMPDKIDTKIVIDKMSGLTLKFPSAQIAAYITPGADETDIFFTILKKCIDTVYDADRVYKLSEYTEEEVDEFVQGLNVKTLQKIQEFFSNMPRLYYLADYTAKDGSARKLELNNINDFFMLG